MERKFRLISALECALGCVNESKHVPYWRQFCKFDLSIGRNRLYWLHINYFYHFKLSQLQNSGQYKIQNRRFDTS